MIIKKTSTKTYDIYDCAKWGMTVKNTISAREQKGMKSAGLDKCFICGKRFDGDYLPYLALIRGHKNQFICDECAESVQKVREQDG
jgi:hypothetical protein